MDRKPHHPALGFHAVPIEPRLTTVPILSKISCFGVHAKTLIEKQVLLLQSFLAHKSRYTKLGFPTGPNPNQRINNSLHIIELYCAKNQENEIFNKKTYPGISF